MVKEGSLAYLLLTLIPYTILYYTILYYTKLIPCLTLHCFVYFQVDTGVWSFLEYVEDMYLSAWSSFSLPLKTLTQTFCPCPYYSNIDLTYSWFHNRYFHYYKCIPGIIIVSRVCYNFKAFHIYSTCRSPLSCY